MPLHPLLLLLLLMGLAGCGEEEIKPEPPPPPTRIDLTITAGPNLNPDAANRASPLLFRVYELKEAAGFNGADFFALYGKERETLGGDLVKKEEMMLAPGETRHLAFEPDSASRFLAVFAAFRSLENAQWRAAVAIPKAETTLVGAQIDGTRVVLSAKKQAPPAPPPEEEE